MVLLKKINQNTFANLNNKSKQSRVFSQKKNHLQNCSVIHCRTIAKKRLLASNP